MAEYQNLSRLKKFKIGSDHIADLSTEVIPTLMKYLQTERTSTEAGGFLLGYENATSGNITINSLTEPQPEDDRSRVNFIRKHRLPKLNQLEGYIGTWHTHPQNIPFPSFTDYCDWKQCIRVNQKATDRLFFLIAGTSEFRVWIGDCITNKIYEATVWKR